MFEHSAILQIAGLLQKSRLTVALTGAGISVESGIPAFRGSQGLLKPEMVFFGEPIPVPAGQRAFELARTCEVMLVIGTSALVAPASHLPLTAKQNGAVLIEINLERTHLSDTLSDYVLEAPASQALSALIEQLRR